MVQEKISAEYILSEQLAVLSCLEKLLSGHEPELTMKEMDETVAKVRQAWTFAVFSEVTNDALKRYFTYHGTFIFRLLDAGASKYATAPPLFREKICQLLDSLHTYYGEYLEDNIDVGTIYRLYFTNGLKETCRMVSETLEKSDVTLKVKRCLLRYIEEMTGKKALPCTLPQLLYFRLLVEELFYLLPYADSEKFHELIYDKLLELEFNQFDAFVNQQELIRSAFEGKTEAAKLSVVGQYTQLYAYQAQGDVVRYDHRWPPLSQMLSDWLKEVKESIDPGIQINEKRPIAYTRRLRLEFSVSHLACLLRLFAKESLFGATPLTEVFDFFSANFSTKRQDVVSVHGLSKEYYSKNQVTAAEIKAILMKMINRINLDYFPAVAAISAIILCR